ncbi:uncharacterized protein VP01_3825g1 [Puccinia sorghi]|uniref:Uncharacterized protein n=1 Tax=Puccinia sorghi TaxID=27349 RepID=A0A0L6UU22_9BASI|nr:uncharacterized protein VP01_3825g1 [Puccinia sorghi]
MLKKKRKPEADDDQPPIPSMGGAHSAKIVANIRKICAQNPPCKRLTGNHKIPVFINPKNKNQFFRITVDWFTLWALAMKPTSFLGTLPTRWLLHLRQPMHRRFTQIAISQCNPLDPAGNIMYILYQPPAPAPIQYLAGYGHPDAHPTPSMEN